MNVSKLLDRLVAQGYQPMPDGDRIHLKRVASFKPDPAQVVSLIRALKERKADALALLRARAGQGRCRDCAHAEVDAGFAFCRGKPWDGIPGQAPDFPHPCSSIAPRGKPARATEVPIPECRACPWYQSNP